MHVDSDGSMESLDSIVNALRTKRKFLEEVANRLQKEFSNAKADVKSVEDALSKLTGANGRSAKPRRKKASHEQIEQAAHAVLANNRSLSQTELRSEISIELDKLGVSDRGLVTKLNSLLQQSQFAKNGDKFSLASSAQVVIGPPSREEVA